VFKHSATSLPTTVADNPSFHPTHARNVRNAANAKTQPTQRKNVRKKLNY